MKKNLFFAFALLAFSSCASKPENTAGTADTTDTVSTAANAADSIARYGSSLEGNWEWVNNQFGYPVYMDFGPDGSLIIKKMKEGDTDEERYRYNVEDSVIYYTRPGSDNGSVNKMEIVRQDKTTLILKELSGDEPVDIWLERR